MITTAIQIQFGAKHPIMGRVLLETIAQHEGLAACMADWINAQDANATAIVIPVGLLEKVMEQ